MTADQDRPHDPIPSELVQEDDSFTEVVQDFVDGLAARVNEIERAVQAQNFVELRALSRTLKGTAEGFGYPALTRQAANLEACALDEEIADAKEALDTLQNMVARVVIRY